MFKIQAFMEFIKEWMEQKSEKDTSNENILDLDSGTELFSNPIYENGNLQKYHWEEVFEPDHNYEPSFAAASEVLDVI